MTEDTKNILRLFQEHVQELRTHSLLKSKDLKIKTSVTLDGNRVVIRRHAIDEEKLESFLMRLRRFNSDRDDLFLPKILNIISRYDRIRTTQIKVRDIRDQFLCRRKYCGLKCRHDGKVYTELEIFNLMINGRFFHVDKAKKAELSGITDPTLFEFDMFLGAVINKANAVLRAGEITNKRE